MFAILCLIQIAYSYVGDTSCIGQTQSNCQGFGYCYWNGVSCENESCYKVDEIAACRSGGALNTPTVICKSLELTQYQQTIYANVCSEPSEITGDLIPFFTRYQEPLTGFPDKSTDGVTLTLWNSLFPQYGYITQLYTIAILKQSFTELSTTIDIYLKYSGLMLYDVYSTYNHELALCYMFQILRDDETAVKVDKLPVINKAWQVMDTLLQRFRIIGSNYTAYYPLYNFQQMSLSRLQVNVTGYRYLSSYTWANYLNIGYIQMLSYDLHQFGIYNQITSVQEFRVYNKADSTVAYIDFTIAYYFTGDYTGLGLIVYQFDRATMTYSSAGTPALTCSYDSITTFQTTCTMNILASSLVQTSYFLVIGTGIATCASHTARYQCKQPTCSWNGATCVNA